jgi:Zn-dependent protease
MVPLGGSLALLGIAGCGMNLVATVSALLPFSPMDGEKIRIWNWMAWLAVFMPVLVLYLMAYL